MVRSGRLPNWLLVLQGKGYLPADIQFAASSDKFVPNGSPLGVGRWWSIHREVTGVGFELSCLTSINGFCKNKESIRDIRGEIPYLLVGKSLFAGREIPIYAVCRQNDSGRLSPHTV